MRKRAQIAASLRREDSKLSEGQSLDKAAKIIKVLWNINHEDDKKAPSIHKVRSKQRRAD